jgi:hypothetical protein
MNLKVVFCLLVIICLLGFEAYPQNPKIRSTAFWKFLIKSNFEINHISNTSTFRHLVLPGNHSQFNQDIIKTQNGLYILLSGTGIVYKFKTELSDSLEFERIDATTHFGYNYGAIHFTWNNQLYSFGGYGFWRQNGHLRRYANSNEWILENIEKEVSTVLTPILFDPSKSILYYIHNPEFEILDKESNPIDFRKPIVCSVELNSGKQTQYGFSNSNVFFVSSEIPLFFISVPFLEGCIIRGKAGFYLIQFPHNKVFQLKSKKIAELLLQTKHGSIQYAFASKNKLFLTNQSGALDSVDVSMNDFIPVNEPVYVPFPVELDYRGILIGLIICSLIALLFFRERKWRRQLRQSKLSDAELPIETNEIQFTSMELLVLKELQRSAENGVPMTVATMNSLLGLNKKSIEVQKKTRNDIVNNINSKHKLKNKSEQDLILRIRTTSDKRYFEYVLNNS